MIIRRHVYIVIAEKRVYSGRAFAAGDCGGGVEKSLVFHVQGNVSRQRRAEASRIARAGPRIEMKLSGE